MIQVTGVLVDPFNIPMQTTIRVIAKNSEESVLSAEASITTDVQGRYDFNLLNGDFRIDVFIDDEWNSGEFITVDENTPSPIPLPVLLSEFITGTVPNLVDTDGDTVIDILDEFPNDPTEWSDTDRDGIGNNTDTDDDGDGVPDVTDAFPLDPSEDTDTDNDGIGDNTDPDIDGDGTPNELDAFPLDPTETTDTDGDGVGDNADAFPNDPTETLDTDLDGIGNNADLDDDGDGFTDVEEIAAGSDPLDPVSTPVVGDTPITGYGAIIEGYFSFGGGPAVSEGDVALDLYFKDSDIDETAPWSGTFVDKNSVVVPFDTFAVVPTDGPHGEHRFVAAANGVVAATELPPSGFTDVVITGVNNAGDPVIYEANVGPYNDVESSLFWDAHQDSDAIGSANIDSTSLNTGVLTTNVSHTNITQGTTLYVLAYNTSDNTKWTSTNQPAGVGSTELYLNLASSQLVAGEVTLVAYTVDSTGKHVATITTYNWAG